MSSERSQGSLKQYSLWAILGIWAAAAAPMGILGWIVAPALARNSQSAFFVRLAILTIGLAWQFCVVIILLWRLDGGLKWGSIKRLLWLVKPSSPRSGKASGWMWFWIIPLIAITALFEMNVTPKVQHWWTTLLPFLSEPNGYSLGAYLGTPAGKAQMVGSWGIFVLFILNAVFNTFLGEELLFRGILLPRMQGTFGRWAWVANGILFGLYHVHQPWVIVDGIITGTLLFALPTRIFKSSWFGIVLHSGQSIFFIFVMLGMVLGLA